VKASTILEKVSQQRTNGEKEQILKELSALLICTPSNRTKARNIIEKAIDFIEEK
jgi:hypothetical protein